MFARSSLRANRRGAALVAQRTLLLFVTTVQTPADLKSAVQSYFWQLQDRICATLERIDGRARFREDRWSHVDGGGGRTRVIERGAVFEKGGVNVSAVTTKLSEKLASRLGVRPQEAFGTGISLVVHPESPHVPTVHANLRYFRLADGDSWFGGGLDLTPCYLVEEDCRHFHRTLKSVCDRHSPDYYPRFKKWCDEYFVIKHRQEARGVGGIFFDYQRDDLDRFFGFVQDVGEHFLPAYAPIVERRHGQSWHEHEKRWQLIRRGRYVEFNLVYDRGTLFGLETEGRTESILVSLPPCAVWMYDHRPEPDSREAELLDVLRSPREWA